VVVVGGLLGGEWDHEGLGLLRARLEKCLRFGLSVREVVG
jgi:hypothetical protein